MSCRVVIISPSIFKLKLLITEANISRWASSSLDHCYAFIDKMAADNFIQTDDVPRLRFAEAGLAASFTQVKKQNKITAKLVATYFVEEKLRDGQEGGADPFLRLIGNGSAATFKRPDPEIQNVVDFLSFTQHFQYFKSGGLFFISDYQGQGTLIARRFTPSLTACLVKAGILCDPQILTSP